jgi:hypothetical protein
MSAMPKPSVSSPAALAAFAAVLATLGLACEPAAPGMPTYSADVKPILDAHCIRCHGAGGTLRGDATPYPLGTPPAGYKTNPPAACYLHQYPDDPVDCSKADGGPADDCKVGAHACATITYLSIYLPTMPPAPATLNAWERDILTRWAKNPLP